MIGGRIRAQRRELGMSLTELAERTGLSKGFLSGVERDLSNPSINSLSLIADALGTPVFLFFVEDDPERVVVLKSERKEIQLPDSRFRYEAIWFGMSRKMEILIAKLSAGQCSTDQPRSHRVADSETVEECFFVLQGTVELEIGGETCVLDPGDSAYFNGTIPHRYAAVGEEDLVLLLAISPPAFSRL
jgi:transcriptional regulator with XRE-family HTH domain